MSYNERLTDILAAFGLTPTQHLPADGMPSRLVFVYIPSVYQGAVRVWIDRQQPAAHGYDGRIWKRATHRVMAACPVCNRALSAGRLHQHIHTVACHRHAGQ